MSNTQTSNYLNKFIYKFNSDLINFLPKSSLADFSSSFKLSKI